MTESFQNINKVLLFITGFILSVFVSSFVFISPLVSILFFIIAGAVLIVEKIVNNKISQEVLLLSLLIFSFSIGSLRYAIKDFHEAGVLTQSGIVISEPEQKENSTRFILRDGSGEKVLVSTDLYSPVEYGDEVKIDGKIENPGIIEGDDGRDFDYGKYLAKDDIYFTSSFTKVEIISKGNGNVIKSSLFKIKNTFVNKIRDILPEPESSLLAGLIVAGKAAMPENILEDFRRAGVVHIVVLSGYNITIIAEFIRKFLEKVFLASKLSVSPRILSGTSLIGILLFVIMTGAEATVVRAALMVVVVMLANVFGRKYSASRALMGAAFLMVLQNPKILVYDPSFQLSFLATCGLVFLTPVFEKLLLKIKMGEGFGIRTILATTLATQITVLPLLIYSVGDISLVSLPANLLILIFIPYAMFFGFLATLIAFLHPYIAFPLTFITHLILKWVLGVSHFLGSLTFAAIKVPAFPFWIVILFYILVIFTLKRYRVVLEPQTSSD